MENLTNVEEDICWDTTKFTILDLLVLFLLPTILTILITILLYQLFNDYIHLKIKASNKTHLSYLVKDCLDQANFLRDVDCALQFLIDSEILQIKRCYRPKATSYESYCTCTQYKQSVSMIANHVAGHLIGLWFSNIKHVNENFSVFLPYPYCDLPLYTLMEDDTTSEQFFENMCLHLAGILATSLLFKSEDLKLSDHDYDTIRFAGIAKVMGNTHFELLKGKKYRKTEWEYICFYVHLSFIATKIMVEDHLEDIEKVSDLLLEKKVLKFKEMKYILGERPIKESSLYEKYVLNQKSKLINTTLDDVLKVVEDYHMELSIDKLKARKIDDKTANEMVHKKCSKASKLIGLKEVGGSIELGFAPC